MDNSVIGPKNRCHANIHNMLMAGGILVGCFKPIRFTASRRRQRHFQPSLPGGVMCPPGRQPKWATDNGSFVTVNETHGGAVDLQERSIARQQANELDRVVEHGLEPRLTFQQIRLASLERRDVRTHDQDVVIGRALFP